MSASPNKFNKSRKKFRASMEREKAKVRRTIFLEDDDVPTTSRRARGHPKNKRGPKPVTTPRPQATFPPRRTVTPSQNQANHHPSPQRCYRMSTAPQSQPVEDEVFQRNPIVPETIVIEDDDIPPPPPILQDHGDYATLEDWELFDHCDLFDGPLLEELRRTFCGADDCTIDYRVPTPPSPFPPPSPSSLDSENENYHPPTPPRRQGLGTVEFKERQYQHLGLRCYERALVVRILVPDSQHTAAIQPPRTPPRLSNNIATLNQTTPPTTSNNNSARTPGRGWLYGEVISPKHTGRSVDPTTRTPRPIARVSPRSVVSSPTMATAAASPSASSDETPLAMDGRSNAITATRITVTPEKSYVPLTPPWPKAPLSMTMEQLPSELKDIVNEALATRSEHQRVRFRTVVNGQQYQVSIARSGSLQVTWLPVIPREEGE